VITTSIPCLLILGLGYRCITKEPTHLALVRCAPVIALVAGGWLISAVLFDTLIDVNLFGQPKLYTQAELWADVRFYLGWAMGLILAPPPSNAISYETVERSRNS
jgi:hypothetical protein